MMKSLLMRACGLSVLAFSLPGHATLGPFDLGNGIQSLGMGGVSYSHGTETTALGGNPAHALGLGNRFDLGIGAFNAVAHASISGNSLAADGTEESDGQAYYAIPQGGYVRQLSDRWAIGVTILAAGLGPDYDGSPFARFGGNPDRARLALTSSGISTALAFRVFDSVDLGVSLNTGYQTFSVIGLEFLDNAALSASPGQVTDGGKDGVFTIGASVGVIWRIDPSLTAGLSYRSQNHNARHRDYRGLIANGGRLQLPAIFGGGLSYRVSPKLIVVAEAQRYAYSGEDAFSNGLDRLQAGSQLGAAGGPGFGYDDQTVYKLGASFDVSPQLTLRAGYAYATQIVTRENTLFSFIGPVTLREHYSTGFTWRWTQWDVSGYSYLAARRKVRGEGSIPDAFGGGEADIQNRIIGFGLSVGRRF